MVFQVINLLSRNRDLADHLLVRKSAHKSSADDVIKHSKPKYSSAGSNRRGLEELVMVQLVQFLRAAEGKLAEFMCS